jgi:hypothetical protein
MQTVYVQAHTHLHTFTFTSAHKHNTTVHTHALIQDDGQYSVFRTGDQRLAETSKVGLQPLSRFYIGESHIIGKPTRVLASAV